MGYSASITTSTQLQQQTQPAQSSSSCLARWRKRGAVIPNAARCFGVWSQELSTSSALARHTQISAASVRRRMQHLDPWSRCSRPPPWISLPCSHRAPLCSCHLPSITAELTNACLGAGISGLPLTDVQSQSCGMVSLQLTRRSGELSLPLGELARSSWIHWHHLGCQQIYSQRLVQAILWQLTLWCVTGISWSSSRATLSMMRVRVRQPLPSRSRCDCAWRMMTCE
mmetsp:Transcript_63922/g.121899  ORF Transcript_63922/g.121899 Transcript_63922/m.121899 type:complete len:227 (-) Transcript_63922:818-1498(-)